MRVKTKLIATIMIMLFSTFIATSIITPNVSAGPDVPSGTSKFANLVKYAGNPLSVPSSASGVVHPDVLYFPSGMNGWEYWMAYTPLPPDSLEHPWIARSHDGITWIDIGANPVLNTGVPDADPAILYIASLGKWFMVYAPYWYPAQKIALAYSTDGINWTPYNGNPVNGNTNPVILSGVDTGSQAWESSGGVSMVAEPNLLYEGGTFYLYYCTYVGGNNRGKVGFATFTWDNIGNNILSLQRYAGNPVVDLPGDSVFSSGCGHADISKSGSKYYMYVVRALVSSGAFELALLTSTDKISWTYQGRVLQRGPSGQWDDQHIYRSCLVTDALGNVVVFSGTIKLYYSAYRSGIPKIGLATGSDAPVSYIFQHGFEGGNFGTDPETGYAWTTTYGSPSVVTETKHHGTYGMKVTFTATWQTQACRRNVATNPLYLRWYFEFAFTPSNNQYGWKIATIEDSTSPYTIANIMVRYYGGNYQIGIAIPRGASTTWYNFSFAQDTWYCVEYKFYLHSSTGEHRLWLNGIEVITLTGLNTGGDPLSNFQIGYASTQVGSGTIYHDCVFVADKYIGCAVAPDINPPTYSNVGTNATWAGQPCKFHAKWTDDVGLSGYIFSTNNTGAWLNDAWTPLTGISDWSNVTKILSSTGGVLVQYQFYCNDTSNNWQSTPIQSLMTESPVNQLFSVWSNSTVSNIAFNAPAREITFTVTGPTDTMGYLRIFLSKNLLPNIDGLKIYFDGVPKAYDAVSVEDGWYIHLTYHHSTHIVRIVLPSASPTYTVTQPATIFTVSIVIALIASFTSLTLLRKKKITKQTRRPSSLF